MFLLEAFISQGFCPNVIRSGRRFKLVSLDELNIKILPSYNYFSGDEFVLAKLFDVKYSPSFFPYAMLSDKYIQYKGKIPTSNWFLSEFDSTELREEKLAYYAMQDNRQWCFIKELLSYSDFKLNLLAIAVLTFL